MPARGPGEALATLTDFRLAHLGVAVADVVAAAASYNQMFGSLVLAGPFEDPIQRVRVCFLGDPAGAGRDHRERVTVELVSPLGEKSPVRRVLSQGGGAYHLCYDVANLAAAIDHLRSQGCLLVSDAAPAVAFGGKQLAWLYTPQRQLIEVVERG